MRLKTWLLLSYLIVMILPLIAAYLLFAWISSYNDDQVFTEYLNKSGELQEIKNILDEPQLYYPKAAKEAVDKLANDQQSIILYNKDGLILYTSNPSMNVAQFSIGISELYKGLYTLEQGYSTYDYKQPVFDEGSLVGFFHVELARDEWTAGVSDRSWLVLGLFILFFSLIYLSIIFLVNRKLNRRLKGLMDEMTAFAHGETVAETKTNNDEIGELKRRFYNMRKQVNLAKEVIEQEQHEKEYMVATISHDLKTPLTSIKAYAEAIDNERELTKEEQKEYRQVIIEKSDFMKEMLNDLLTYTLLQSPTYKMEFVQVDGTEFFDMLISGYEALCKAKNIKLNTFSHVTGTYEVNPKQMMRVADNLMSNAIQHTRRDGTIWLATISDEKETEDWLFNFSKESVQFNFNEYIYLIVQNEGQGIVEEKLTQIFNPLYQADEARSKQADHGTGLGLSITKQILMKHGGDVEVASRKNIGTTVICRLPKMKGKGL